YLHNLRKNPHFNDHVGVIKRLPIFKEIGQNVMIDLESNEKNWHLLPREYENPIIVSSNTINFLAVTSEATRYLLEDVIKIPRLPQKRFWIECVIPYLKSKPNIDIEVLEKLFDQLPSKLLRSDRSLRNELANTTFVPGGTIRMAQEKEGLGTVNCKPIDLFDPSHEISQLFFDDEKVFPAGKFSSEHYDILKKLGIKTSLTQMDIIERIKIYIERREKRNNINSNDLHDKSLNLFRYIDKHWNSFESMKNTEFSSAIKSSQWIPTIDKTGKKIFSCWHKDELRDKKNKSLVLLVVPILDYQVESLSLREFLGWNTHPPSELILQQIHQCSIMSKSDLNFKNRSQICEAIYEHINEALSCDDEQYKLELSKGLKNKKWIFCGGNFYAAKNVFFDLSENLGRNFIQLSDDYRNRFKKVFEYMGVEKTIEINDLIKIINEIELEANHNSLSEEKLSEIIKFLRHIADKRTKEEVQICDLKGLLIPSADSTLFKHKDVYFDDRPELNKEEKKNYKLSHPKITPELAENLGIRMLSTIFLKCCEIEFEASEQSVPSIPRIKNIINVNVDNADDVGARRFSIYLDERKFDKNFEQSTLLSKEMHNWQGPSVWIYYDKSIEENDFSNHKNKIGHAGIISSYYLTDILSFVSGNNVTFLDPHAWFLPLQGYPPKKPRKIQFNFLENKFLAKFKDQCNPYFAIEDCDFNKEFNGTLFRLPLRSIDLSKQSLISQNSTKPQEILNYFQNIKNHQELLFLRNVELYNVYHINKNENKQLIWEMEIQNLGDNNRNIRRKVDYTPQVLQLNTRMYDTKKTTFELWLVCLGGNSEKSVGKNLINFSKKKRLKAYGGVAAILARSDNEDDLLNKIRPINLEVYINGDFYWSLDGKDILQSNNNDIYAKWNRHILCDVLPPLHVKLLNEIAKKDLKQFKNSKTSPENFSPYTIKKFMLLGNEKEIENTLIDSYRTKVLQSLGDGEVFWTEAEGGKFISLKNAYFFEESDYVIADIFSKHGISTVKMDKYKLGCLNEKIKGKDSINSRHKILQENVNIQSVIEQEVQKDFMSGIGLLKFILQDENNNLYSKLNGLKLVPLKNDSFGIFGKRDYYIAEKKCQEIFSESDPSRFIYDSDDELIEVFKNERFLELRIKRLDTHGILDLLAEDLPDEQEINWNPSSKSIPNRKWLDNVFKNIELDQTIELPNRPLLPVIRPSHKLVKIDPTNPLLIYPDDNDTMSFIVEVLIKLGICFTDMKLPKKCTSALTQSVLSFNVPNVFKTIKQLSRDISIETLFNNAKLDDDDYIKLRNYVKRSIKGQNEKTLNIIRELPIWPIRLPKKNRFISANVKGILPPHNLSCPPQDTDIFDVQDEYYDVLISLGVEKIEVCDFFKRYYRNSGKPTEQDVKFLKEILSLGDERIKNYLLREHEKITIPNKSLKAFVKASTLYDANVDLFNQIFDDDKFLPLELQESNICHNILLKMGLKRDLNGSIYLECAEEIQKKINNDGSEKSYLSSFKSLIGFKNDNDKIRSASIKLISLLKEKYNIFNDDELKQLYKINFVPSKKVFKGPYSKSALPTLGYESFNSLCFAKYQDICWTQAKFIYSDIELPFDLRPGLKMVINHWIKLSTEVFPSEASGWNADKIYEIMQEIYKVVNDSLKFLDEDKIREFKLKDKNLFLNGDNPFDPNCWVPGKKLVFGLQNNINGRFDVHDRLLSFKKLLIALGAEEVDNNIRMDEIPVNYSQNFAEYFDWHFTEKPIDYITIDGVQRETYEVLLRWLYGMSYEDAVKDVFPEDFPNCGQQYLDFMLEILKVS
ncbi:13565_t:CDS:2, partial [Racocetra fulgida]